ncbi:hypothetical protein SUDANB171_00073 [Streptomyces sp. enrichment culture]
MPCTAHRRRQGGTGTRPDVGARPGPGHAGARSGALRRGGAARARACAARDAGADRHRTRQVPATLRPEDVAVAVRAERRAAAQA